MERKPSTPRNKNNYGNLTMNNVKVHWVRTLARAREGEYATPQRRQQGQDGQCPQQLSPYLPATLLSLASASNVAALP